MCIARSHCHSKVCVVNFSPTGAVDSLSTGVAASIAAVTGTIGLLVGFLAGVIVYHCISKYRFKSSSFKPEPSSHQPEQQQAVSSSIPLQQTSPEYEEVIEMRKNSSYGEFKKLEKRAIISQQSSDPESSSQLELRRNRSYEFRKNFEMRADTSMHQSQSSDPESSSQQQQQKNAEYEEPLQMQPINADWL